MTDRSPPTRAPVIVNATPFFAVVGCRRLRASFNRVGAAGEEGRTVGQGQALDDSGGTFGAMPAERTRVAQGRDKSVEDFLSKWVGGKDPKSSRTALKKGRRGRKLRGRAAVLRPTVAA